MNIMKHYLVIAMDIDLSAPGIVYGKLLNEMQKTCRLSVICPSLSSNFRADVELLPCKPYKRLNHRLERQLYRFLGKNIIDSIWSKKVFDQVKGVCRNNDFDCIISFTACYTFASLYLGKLLKNSLNKKWIVYSVDAIPAPLQWNPNKRLYDNVKRQLQKTLQSADAFYSANPIMLLYELELFGDFKGNTGVVLTPHDNMGEYKSTEHKGFRFLYTGNIYGPRKVDALIEAFEKFSRLHPNSNLTFVGKFFSTIQRDYQHLVDEGRVVFHGFTDNLTPYYEAADVLIDIAADLPNDVFLSSKVVNYLPIKKPIIAISGDNSPVRLLLGNIPSILHCKHDKEEIFKILESSISIVGHDFYDRNVALEKFATQNVVTQFLKDIEDI